MEPSLPRQYLQELNLFYSYTKSVDINIPNIAVSLPLSVYLFPPGLDKQDKPSYDHKYKG